MWQEDAGYWRLWNGHRGTEGTHSSKPSDPFHRCCCLCNLWRIGSEIGNRRPCPHASRKGKRGIGRSVDLPGDLTYWSCITRFATWKFHWRASLVIPEFHPQHRRPSTTLGITDWLLYYTCAHILPTNSSHFPLAKSLTILSLYLVSRISITYTCTYTPNLNTIPSYSAFNWFPSIVDCESYL